MHSIASSAGVRRLFATSILARLPLAMLSIGLLVHAQHLTGSFAAAGVVTGVYAIALGVGGPLLGQLVDRRGQTSVLPPWPLCCWSRSRCSRWAPRSPS
jgi:MFS family permease